MRNLEAIKNRFLKDPLEVKIGNLAADLARVSSFSENINNRKAVEDILEEAKFFTEWVAPEAPFKIQVALSEIQPRLALWQRHFIQQREAGEEMEELKKLTKKWSTHLLKATGLL